MTATTEPIATELARIKAELLGGHQPQATQDWADGYASGYQKGYRDGVDQTIDRLWAAGTDKET